MNAAKNRAQGVGWVLIILGGAGIVLGWKLRSDYGGLETMTPAGSISTLGAVAFFLGIGILCAAMLATFIVDELNDAAVRRTAAAAAPPLPADMQLGNQPGWQPQPPAGWQP